MDRDRIGTDKYGEGGIYVGSVQNQHVLLGELTMPPVPMNPDYRDYHDHKAHAVSRKDNLWGVNPTFTWSMASSIPAWAREFIYRGIEEIQKYAVIRFVYLSDNNASANVRISNMEGTGAWAYTGNDTALIDHSLPTMNFGNLSAMSSEPKTTQEVMYADYTVVHEFLHFLGREHEQNHPGKPGDIILANIVRDTGMTEESAQHVYGRWASDVDILGPFDGESIMMYPMDKDWSTENVEYGMTYYMSNMDKEWLRRYYPKDPRR